ncbi:hypothetical protein EIN_197910 [Entamoeba invadens IP1]|uniref:TLDc domain-containing protein n=1 Tax=Entamoeba invadens IP1 TaxID=370355 RepID=A0A0A1TWZ1_ENTIV|nr:hypothetical protein EIN_197910 [Entamoeba invadens IP1]ELP83848.1 hypothetical protein EIN_197910 [Entamoeba invadens IP1]|eukprot:XP_004183194.1 hypothetical protein EIN_197910 [Entamoeba invadens IP1]
MKLNFNEDLQQIEQTIAEVKESSQVYKNSLMEWIKEESKDIHMAWSLKRTPGISQYLKQLTAWTNKMTPSILFDSTVDAPTSLFEKIRDKGNIMTVVETDGGNVFGSYHSVLPTKPSEWVVKDPNHFVFTLKNPFNGGVNASQKFTPIRPDCYPLWIYKSGNALFCVQYFCHVSNNKQCYINSKEWSGKAFEEIYNDVSGKGGKLFTKTVYPARFGLKRFVCLSWK